MAPGRGPRGPRGRLLSFQYKVINKRASPGPPVGSPPQLESTRSVGPRGPRPWPPVSPGQDTIGEGWRVNGVLKNATSDEA